MGFIFKNLFVGEIISSNGGLVFRKLVTTLPSGLESIKIDLSALRLPPGEYVIAVTSNAAGLESAKSNTVTFTVK